MPPTAMVGTPTSWPDPLGERGLVAAPVGRLLVGDDLAARHVDRGGAVLGEGRGDVDGVGEGGAARCPVFTQRGHLG